MQSTSSPKTVSNDLDASSTSKEVSNKLDSGSTSASISNSKRRRRQEKRQKRLQDTKHLLFTKHFSNYRLPVAVASEKLSIVHLSRHDSISDRDRHPPLYVIPDQKSQWARLRMIACPCHGCKCTLDPNGFLSHYINAHMTQFEVPFAEVPLPIEKQTLRATCNLHKLYYDVNTLLGVFGYKRIGLNPLNCSRNTLLPKDFRKYSQHTVLLLFACHTRHSLLWQRGKVDDVLVIWVSTPLQGASISMRCVVQATESTRYYSKRLQARPLPASTLKAQACRDFIKTDCNAIVISYQDLWPLMSVNVGRQELNVELHITGELKI